MDIGHAIKSVTTGMPVLLTGGKPGCRAGEERLSYNKIDAPESIAVSSEAFGEAAPIPRKYSQDGMNISPPLRWTATPAGAKSVVLIVEDPDAPTPNPYVHWLAYNIGPDQEEIPEGSSAAISSSGAFGFREGKNSTLHVGYVGAAPPKGDDPHHYHFQVYALDRMLELAPGAGRSALVEAMEGHALAKGRLIGTYQR